MKLDRRHFLLACASPLALVLTAGFKPPKWRPHHRPSRGDGDDLIEDLLSRMTLEEKIGQLSLYADMVRTGAADVNPASAALTRDKTLAEIRAGRVTGLFNGIGVEGGLMLQKAAVEGSRLGIPLIFGADIAHGLAVVFPVPVGEACSFEPDLCRRTAQAAALEGTARGNHWTFAPMVDVTRDQRWGRVAEGAGEDPFLGSLIAAARVEGFQGQSLDSDTAMLACVKHFAAYGAVEGGMEYNTSDISEVTLRQVHLPAFKAAIDAGCLGVMSSFNDVGGIPSTANRHLLTDILRGEWGFQGLVVSDYMSDQGLMAHGFAADEREAARKSILAGCDMSMQSGLYMRQLPGLVQSGAVPEAVIDESVRRVLRVKKAIGLFEKPYRSLDPAREQHDLKKPEALLLAREAARKSCVLLKNEHDLLPLDRSKATVALIGPLASDRFNMNGAWVVFSDGHGEAVTVEAALRARLPDPDRLLVAPGCQLDADLPGGIEAALALAARADVLVLCLGEAQGMSGEAQSRSFIGLPAAQQKLAEALAPLAKPTVVLLSHGRALALEGAVRKADAILATWFLGSAGGEAIADLLVGDAAPQGRLVVSFPQTSGQEPFYYNHRATGRPQQSATDIAYTARYREASFEALFPFGHGLTYTRFRYGPVQATGPVIAAGEGIRVSCEIENIGSRAGHEIAQLYVRLLEAEITQPVRALKGFAHVDLAPGEKTRVSFRLTPADLAYVHGDFSSRAESGPVEVWISPSSATGTPLRLHVEAGA